MARVIKPYTEPQPFPRPLNPGVTEGGPILQPARTGEEKLIPMDYVPAPYVDVDPRGIQPEGYPTNARPIRPYPDPKTY